MIWSCRKCGHEVISKEKPQPIRWSDGHVCYFAPAAVEDPEAEAEREQVQRSLEAQERVRSNAADESYGPVW